MTRPTAELESGEAWRTFCARLAEAGAIITGADAPAGALERAEGFRYLTRLLRIGLEMNLEFADPDFPVFYQASHATAKIGADNPDNVYWNATVRGDADYRITGTRGTIAYLSIGSKANRYHIDGTMASTGELEGGDIPVGPNGEIEIVASAAKRPGAWLPLEADSSMIIIRQSYLDRAAETPGAYWIERIGAPPAPPPLSGQAMAQALDRTASFVFGTATTFANWTRKFAERPNELPDFGQEMYWRAGGDPRIFYCHGYWRLAPGQMWVIETEVPDCPYWNFQLDNWWMESLDYRRHRITLNKHTARLEPDGRLRLIVADRDPGFGNWIDTAGHSEGTALLRWVGASKHPIPECRVEEAPT